MAVEIREGFIDALLRSLKTSGITTTIEVYFSDSSSISGSTEGTMCVYADTSQKKIYFSFLASKSFSQDVTISEIFISHNWASFIKFTGLSIPVPAGNYDHWLIEVGF